MYLDKKKGYVLLEVVLALSIAIMILFISFISNNRNVYDLRDTADKIVTMVRDSHQYFRATQDITTAVKIQYESGVCSITSIRNRTIVETIKVPKNLRLDWAKYSDSEIEGSKNNVNTSISFRREAIFSTSDSGSGLSFYLTDSKSKKFIKITIVPTSGRVYMYDQT